MLPRKRPNLRKQDHVYSKLGYYFITIKTAGNKNFFGRYGKDHSIILSWMGKIADEIWQRNDMVYEQARNDLYRFMPNHLHALVLLKYRAGFEDSGIHLSNLIRSFKRAVTCELRMMTGMPQLEIWQRNYYDRIIHGEQALENVRKYILYNALAQYLVRNGLR